MSKILILKNFEEAEQAAKLGLLKKYPVFTFSELLFLKG